MSETREEQYKSIPDHDVFQRFNDDGILNILGVNAEGTIIYANRAELHSTGYTASEYIGLSLSMVYISERVFETILDSISASQEISNLESAVRCKNGSIKHVLISSRIVPDISGLTYTYLFVRDITAYKKNEDLLSYLNTSAEVLAGARDTRDALDKVSSLIVPKFANWFTIDMYKDGKLELLKLAHEDPAMVKVAAEYLEKYPREINADYGTGLTLKTGQPSFVPVFSRELLEAGIQDAEQLKIINSLGLHSLIVVAMFGKNAITGVVTFISSVPGKHYDETDLRFAQNFANHIGLALENARLNEEAAEEIERRRRIEEELKRTQMQLKSALSSGLIGTWVRDLENNVMYADESLCELFGLKYSSEGLDPYLFINRIHAEDLRESELRLQRAIDARHDYEAEYRIVGKSGEVKWVFARGKTEHDENGVAVRFAGVVGDITERKKAEQALRESEERFRLMAETMPQKIFVTDSEARLIYLNPQWEDFTGFSIDEIHKVSLAHFIHPEDVAENLRKWKECVTSGKEFQYEHRFRAKDGNYYWHLTRALSLTDTDGKSIWIGSITDIDEQKKNEQKKDEFISIASHELKTPLTSLGGYLQILSKITEKEDNVTLKDIVAKTYRQGHKLSALVSDLLDVSKMQAGKMNYNFTEFNFSEIVDDAVSDALNNYPSHHINLKGSPDVLVYGDKHRLEQVLSNLLSNAAKYSPCKAEILLEISASEGVLTVAVQDFGVGIPAEKAPRIFNRFFRVQETSYKFSGLGIGLYISLEIIRRHKGKIWFDSEVEKGSTFTFMIPLEKL